MSRAACRILSASSLESSSWRPSRNFDTASTCSPYQPRSTARTQGAGQRLIWCCKHGRRRLANSVSLHVRSWKYLFTRWSVRLAGVAEWYGPKYREPSGVGRRTTSSLGHSSALFASGSGVSTVSATLSATLERAGAPITSDRIGGASGGGAAVRGGANAPANLSVMKSLSTLSLTLYRGRYSLI